MTTPDVRAALGGLMSAWSVLPFVLILLGIAVIPLIHGPWWERHHNKAIVCFACGLPAIGYVVGLGPPGITVLLDTLHEYYAFIVLLLSLFIIAGGIYVEGDLRATPALNTAVLAIGALVANVVGTTGASMLLIRPLLATNSERRHKTHVFVFFIFLVGNIGGSLLPVGDPPLFLGYVLGVPFFWTLRNLWPAWLTEVGVLLAVFYLWDRRAWARESAADLDRDRAETIPLRLRGGHNLILLGAMLASVALCRRYQMADGVVWDVSWLQQPVMLSLALLSLAVDYAARARRTAGGRAPTNARALNGFTFGPMIEVAVLFLGIFVTMIPAVCLLAAYGVKAGISTPAQFYWLSGGFSSFLDNAPAYATSLALGQSVTRGLLASGHNATVVLTHSGPIAARLLLAISLGSVFMGANSYIGNAPNLMIKSICDEAGVKMPGFLGYMVYAAVVLVPTYLLITILFLR